MFLINRHFYCWRLFLLMIRGGSYVCLCASRPRIKFKSQDILLCFSWNKEITILLDSEFAAMSQRPSLTSHCIVSSTGKASKLGKTITHPFFDKRDFRYIRLWVDQHPQGTLFGDHRRMSAEYRLQQRILSEFHQIQGALAMLPCTEEDVTSEFFSGIPAYSPAQKRGRV